MYIAPVIKVPIRVTLKLRAHIWVKIRYCRIKKPYHKILCDVMVILYFKKKREISLGSVLEIEDHYFDSLSEMNKLCYRNKLVVMFRF